MHAYNTCKEGLVGCDDLAMHASRSRMAPMAAPEQSSIPLHTNLGRNAREPQVKRGGAVYFYNSQWGNVGGAPPTKVGCASGPLHSRKKKIVYSMDQRLSNNELTSVMHESRSASGGTKKAAHSINRCAVINYYWELRKGISEVLLDVVSGPEALQHRSISGCIAKGETDPFTENTHAVWWHLSEAKLVL